jgi:hypothetical protein
MGNDDTEEAAAGTATTASNNNNAAAAAATASSSREASVSEEDDNNSSKDPDAAKNVGRKRTIDESILEPDDLKKLESRRAYNRQCAAKGAFAFLTD